MEKQSAIFRVDGVIGSEANDSGIVEVDMDADIPPAAPNSTTAPGNVVVGISIEPLTSITAQLTALKASAAETAATSTALTVVRRPPSTKVLAQRIIKNAFNFLASFAGGEGGNEMVPLKSFREWWIKFERRVENDPGFLEREIDG